MIRLATNFAALATSVMLLNSAYAQDVGIIQGRDGCPAGMPELEIVMDNEDHKAASSISGWVGANSLDGNRNLTLRFCRIAGSALLSAPGPFAVLALGDCPAGTWTIRRTFDAEDRNNLSHFNPNSTAALPNFMTYGVTELYFCVYQGVSGGAFPELKREYGVFSDQWNLPAALEFGELYSDDEDDNKGPDTWNRNDNGYRYPIDWPSHVTPPHPLPDVSTCCRIGIIFNGFWLTWASQLSYFRGEENTRLSLARVGTTAPKPQAVCTTDPSSGVDSIYTAFDGNGSFARGGKYLASYEWTFPAGSTSAEPGPHHMFYTVAPGSAAEFVATLRVTDNEGETAMTTCSVIVSSSQPCTGGNCEIE